MTSCANNGVSAYSEELSRDAGGQRPVGTGRWGPEGAGCLLWYGGGGPGARRPMAKAAEYGLPGASAGCTVWLGDWKNPSAPALLAAPASDTADVSASALLRASLLRLYAITLLFQALKTCLILLGTPGTRQLPFLSTQS